LSVDSPSPVQELKTSFLQAWLEISSSLLFFVLMTINPINAALCEKQSLID